MSAVEVVLAMTLLAVVVQAAWTVFAGQRRAARQLTARTEIMDAERTILTVLSSEVAAGVAGRDWVLSAPGVLDLRAFRGWAAACPPGEGSELLVAYRGQRAPDPSKDSVLVLEGSGTWTPVVLERTAASDETCAGADDGLPAVGGSVQRWTLGRAVDRAVLLRLFERGSYHLTDGILRYRRGSGGRQPLTPPGLDPSGTRLERRDPGAVVLTVGRPADPTAGWSRPLLGNGEGSP